MSHTPLELAGSLQIGTVDFVAPDKIEVVLIGEAPESNALNSGVPRPFPRVNDYLLIPVDESFLVGQIEWITIDRSPFPDKRGIQNSGLVNLPYPRRKLRLNPLGTLRTQTSAGRYVFQRGSDALPSIGASVMLPTDFQLRSVVEGGSDLGRVTIGTSPLAGNVKVSVDPSRLFGRHLAVLGNTGSGKSCSVAGLIRWSLEQAQRERCFGRPNARFVVLDPNGEYSRAFSDNDIAQARIFKVNSDDAESALTVPLWFWNSAEWSSFTRASAGAQRPLLVRALRDIKAGRTVIAESTDEERKFALRSYLSSVLISIRRSLSSGEIRTRATNFGGQLEANEKDLKEKIAEFPNNHLAEVKAAITQSLQPNHRESIIKGELVEYYTAFSEGQVRPIVGALQKSVNSLGGIVYSEGPDEDIPLLFSGAALADHIEVLAHQENSIQHLEPLIARIRTLLANPRLRAIIDDTERISLQQWLEDYIGVDEAEKGCVSVIDLSLVPSEVIHIVTAVIARLIFEAHQRYVKQDKDSLPTVLVMEEAHTFIRRYREDTEIQDAATVCCQAFERIAREGRKFGLSLVLSSQRPHEISPTVLSQCNTFLLHRLSNDRDQEIVHRLVPDNLRGLMRELPALPSQTAILLGWAAELPVLVRVNDLPQAQQPVPTIPNSGKCGRGQHNEESTGVQSQTIGREGGRTAKMKRNTRLRLIATIQHAKQNGMERLRKIFPSNSGWAFLENDGYCKSSHVP